MSGDRGAPKGALVARRCHRDNTASHCTVKSTFQGPFAFTRRLRKGGTHVDNACARVDRLHDCRSKLLRSSAGPLCPSGHGLSEDRADQQSAVGADGRGRRTPLRGQHARDKRAVHARLAGSLRTRATHRSRNLLDMLLHKIGMTQKNRSVYQRHLNFRPTTAVLHQRCQSHDFQRIGMHRSVECISANGRIILRRRPAPEVANRAVFMLSRGNATHVRQPLWMALSHDSWSVLPRLVYRSKAQYHQHSAKLLPPQRQYWKQPLSSGLIWVTTSRVRGTAGKAVVTW
jgi:hypothetical protein